MESSKPLVVTKATRPPLRCSNALVPTVVPCNSVTGCVPAILHTVSVIGREGSAGVENNFSMRSSLVAGSIHTQSVKVPPVSMAMRNGALALAGMMSAPHEYIGGDKDKENHGDHAIHSEECGVQPAQVVHFH